MDAVGMKLRYELETMRWASIEPVRSNVRSGRDDDGVHSSRRSKDSLKNRAEVNGNVAIVLIALLIE